MKKTTSLLCAVAALVAFSGCQGSEPGDQDPGNEAASEEPTGPVYDPTALLTLSYTPPADLVENPEVPLAPLLPYETFESTSFDINQPDIGAENRIFITQYLLPEDSKLTDYNAQLEVVREYDALVGNTADDGSHNPALVARNPGIWRFVIIVNGEDKTYQQNYFVFVENHLVQITCQWTNRRSIVRPLCGEFQQTLSFE